MRYIKVIIIFFLIVFHNLSSQSKQTELRGESILQSGPMLGYSEMSEVLLWVQTKEKANVYFEYWEVDDDSQKFKTDNEYTNSVNAFTAKLIANNLKPGTKYSYQLFINNQEINLAYTTEFQTKSYWDKKQGNPKDFKLALGSCVYINDENFDVHGKGKGGEYHIFNSIVEKKPDFMIWLGDNIYTREGEWNNSTGINYRYTHTRSLAEMQPLLASIHNYAIWDDHDYGPNDSDRSFIHKDKTLESFKLFWGNPSFGLPGSKGITTMFTWQDVDFFLLDNRYHRAPIFRKTGDRTQLGKVQLEWLIDALVFSKASFKMIVLGNLFLSTEKGYSQNYINGYQEERNYILRRIEEENIKNVYFITGDKHFSEASMIRNDNGDEIFEFSFSPLTASVSNRSVVNHNQIKGSLIQNRNFGIIEFSGKLKERKLSVIIFDSYGKEQWRKVFKLKQ